jgi:hypothetical protein
MATVRISGNWRNRGKMEWAGAPAIDPSGHIERSLDIPEKAYELIERGIARGGSEGTVYLQDGTRFDWLLDR